MPILLQLVSIGPAQFGHREDPVDAEMNTRISSGQFYSIPPRHLPAEMTAMVVAACALPEPESEAELSEDGDDLDSLLGEEGEDGATGTGDGEGGAAGAGGVGAVPRGRAPRKAAANGRKRKIPVLRKAASGKGNGKGKGKGAGGGGGSGDAGEVREPREGEDAPAGGAADGGGATAPKAAGKRRRAPQDKQPPMAKKSRTAATVNAVASTPSPGGAISGLLGSTSGAASPIEQPPIPRAPSIRGGVAGLGIPTAAVLSGEQEGGSGAAGTSRRALTYGGTATTHPAPLVRGAGPASGVGPQLVATVTGYGGMGSFPAIAGAVIQGRPIVSRPAGAPVTILPRLNAPNPTGMVVVSTPVRRLRAVHCAYSARFQLTI